MGARAEYKSYAEIHGQYRSLEQTLDYIGSRYGEIRDFFGAGNGDIVYTACGSSYWMGLSANLSMRLKTGRKTDAVKAGDVLLNGALYGAYADPLFVCPSRSGKTSEVIMALDILKKTYPNSKAMIITGDPNSPLAEKAGYKLFLPWAVERSICQTGFFSNLYLANVLIAEAAAGKTELFDDARRYLRNAPPLYKKHEETAREIAAKRPLSVVCLGGGRLYGVCVEGAYVVIEMAEMNANYYHLMEYRHGPIVTADRDTHVFILSSGSDGAFEKGIAADAAKAGASVHTVSCGGPDGEFDFSLEGDYPGEITALHYIYCMQSLAFSLSVARGRDPDSPGSLTSHIEL